MLSDFLKPELLWYISGELIRSEIKKYRKPYVRRGRRTEKIPVSGILEGKWRLADEKLHQEKI